MNKSPQNSPIQGTLFKDSVLEKGGDCGYGTNTVEKITGLTRRQLDHWARNDIYKPSLQNAEGSGTRRLYSFKDILILQMYKRLEDTGVSIKKISVAANKLKEYGITDLTKVTLVSDGKTIFHVESPEMIVDLLKEGQGVFAISLESLWHETEGILKDFEPTTVEKEIMSSQILEFVAKKKASREFVNLKSANN